MVVGGNISATNTLTVDAGVTRYGGTVSGTVHDNSNVAPVHDASVSGLSTSLNTYLTNAATRLPSISLAHSPWTTALTAS